MKGDDDTEKSPDESEANEPAEGPWRVGQPVLDRPVADAPGREANEASPVADTPAPSSSLMREPGAAPSHSPGHSPTHARMPARASAPKRDEAAAPEDEEDADGFTHEGLPEYEQDDPLAPAYDIEKGTPLNSHRQDLPIRANIKNAKEFFNTELLYRFDILEDPARSEISGRYRIELKGFQGGVWTIQLGDTLDIVNRREDAEIVFTMQQNDFLQLVNGQLNPQLAMFAQKLRVHGDLKKAVAFQALLSPEVD